MDERTWSDGDARRPLLPAPPFALTSSSLGDGWSGRRWIVIDLDGMGGVGVMFYV
jgi:hypothetical protein